MITRSRPSHHRTPRLCPSLCICSSPVSFDLTATLLLLMLLPCVDDDSSPPPPRGPRRQHAPAGAARQATAGPPMSRRVDVAFVYVQPTDELDGGGGALAAAHEDRGSKPLFPNYPEKYDGPRLSPSSPQPKSAFLAENSLGLAANPPGKQR